MNIRVLVNFPPSVQALKTLRYIKKILKVIENLGSFETKDNKRVISIFSLVSIVKKYNLNFEEKNKQNQIELNSQARLKKI